MAQNRYLPYGYRMEAGQLAVDHTEAQVVRQIYQSYAQGQSYTAIAEAMTAAGYRYMPEKPAWNKNMIARILQNAKYRGDAKHPAIIESTLGEAAQLAQKPYTHTEPPAIKILKSKLVCAVCGASVKRMQRVR